MKTASGCPSSKDRGAVIDAWSSVPSGILTDDGLALGAYLESLDLKMRKLQTCLYGNTPCAETDVPKHMLTGKAKSGKGEQSDGHLRNHLLTTV